MKVSHTSLKHLQIEFCPGNQNIADPFNLFIRWNSHFHPFFLVGSPSISWYRITSVSLFRAQKVCPTREYKVKPLYKTYCLHYIAFVEDQSTSLLYKPIGQRKGIYGETKQQWNWKQIGLFWKNHLGMRSQIFPIFTFHFGLKQIIKKIIVTYIAKELLVNLNREGQHVK